GRGGGGGVPAESVEAVDVGEARVAVGARHRPVEVLEGVLGPAHHHPSSMPSAAKPGPRPIISPHSPGAGGSPRSVSSSTNRIVAEERLPNFRSAVRAGATWLSVSWRVWLARSSTPRPAE